MKITYVVSSLEGGGAEFPIPHIIKTLEKLGHSVTLLACHPRDMLAAKKLDAKGIPYHILTEDNASALKLILVLHNHIKNSRPDIIWTSLPSATFYSQIIGKFLGIPVISWQHSAYIVPYKRFLMRCMAWLSELWIADSYTVAEFLKKNVSVSPKKIIIWPIYSVSETQNQTEKWYPGRKFRIGSLGRLHHVKGYNTLIRAISYLQKIEPTLSQNVTFHIAGSGPEEQALKELAQQYSVKNIEFTGFLDNPEPFLASLHAYVQPSLSEGFCLSAHEAMAAGLPVISTYVGELKRTVKPGVTGYHIPIGDEIELANKILMLVKNPELAYKMGQEAKNYIHQHFSEKNFIHVATHITKAINNILERKNNSFLLR